MKRIGLVGLVAAYALTAASCGSSSPKTLIAEVRYQMSPHPGVAGCAPLAPAVDYLGFAGQPVVDGGAALNAGCRANTLSDGTLSFQIYSFPDSGNGITISNLNVDPTSCDATTHVCNVVASSCKVRINENDGVRIAQFEGTCSGTTPAATGACAVSEVTLDSANPDGKTISLRLGCNTLATVPPQNLCDVTDPATVSSPAFLRFSNCNY